MSLGKTKARASGRGVASRWTGLLATYIVPPTVAIVLVLALAASPPLHAQADPGWIGKRVVQKSRDFALQQEGQIVQRTESAFHIYIVERIKGPALWLQAEGRGPSGWAPAGQFVPVDQAIEFFTNRVRTNPRDAFAYIMRGMVWQDESDYEKAIADYTEAIRLDPKDAAGYFNRGLLWAESLKLEKAIADFTDVVRLEPKHVQAYIERGGA